MTYTVNVVNQVNTVTVVESATPAITVIDATGGTFTITETLNTVSIREIVNTQTIYFDAIELKLNDLNNFWRGEWQSNYSGYLHGDLVTWHSNLYLLNTYDPDTTVPYPPSTTPPGSDATWQRIVWHDAPFYEQLVTENGVPATLNGDLEVNGTSNFNYPVYVNSGLYVTNALDVTLRSYLRGGLSAYNSSTFYGPVTFLNDVKIPNSNLTVSNLTVTNTASILGSLNVGDINGSGGVSIAGALRVNGTSTFSTATFNKPVRFNDIATFTQPATFHELDIDRLKVADVLYPTTQGLYGQVIANMGDNTAQWRNLGDLNFWSLNDDLRTNGFNIVSGRSTGGIVPQLKIGRGTSTNFASFLEFNTVNTTTLYDQNITLRTGPLDYRPPGGSGEAGNAYLKMLTTASMFPSTYPVEMFSPAGISLKAGYYAGQPNAQGSVKVDARALITRTLESTEWTGPLNIKDGPIKINGYLQGFKFGGDTIGPVNFGVEGVRFWDGSILRTATTASLPPADYNILGSVTISTSTTSTGLMFLGGGYIAARVATTSTLGSVKIGNYIDVTTDGTISVNTASLASITLNTATTTLLGGIKVGTSFTAQVDGTLNLKTASTATLGGVKVDGTSIVINGNGVISAVGGGGGTGTNVVAGVGISTSTVGLNTVVSLNTASSTTLGGIKVGTNLSITADGTLNASNNPSSGVISLTEDMLTNGYKIKTNTATGAPYIDIDTGVDIISEDVQIGDPNNTSITVKGGGGTNTQRSSAVNFDNEFGDSVRFTSDYKQTTNHTSPISYTGRTTSIFAVNVGSANLRSTSKLTDQSSNGNQYYSETDFSISIGNNEGGYGTYNTSTFSIADTEIKLENRGTILLKSGAYTQVGESLGQSELYVSKIYNYNGTYAPFFPAGVQYADNTVQVTAFHPDGGPLPAV